MRQEGQRQEGHFTLSFTKGIKTKQILSSASKLTSLLRRINAESYEWLMLSALYVSVAFNASFFIEYLNDLKGKGNETETTNFIGGLYLEMFERSTPDFDQAHIRSIVEFLYNAGAMENANKISHIYGARGHEGISS